MGDNLTAASDKLNPDSFQTQYHKAISAIESRTIHVTKRIDSLEHVNLSTTKYAKSLDSLNH